MASPGQSTSEFKLSVSVIIGLAVIAIVAICFRQYLLAASAVTGKVLVTVGYGIGRNIVKRGFNMLTPLSGILAGIDWTNPAVAVDSVLRKVVQSELPKVNASSHPALAVAVASLENQLVTVAEEAVKAYALPLLLKDAGPVLDAIAVKFPLALGEITALKAKFAAL